MKWADPKTYAWLYRESLTEEYRKILLAFLPTDLRAMVMKELSREKIRPAVPVTLALGSSDTWKSEPSAVLPAEKPES